MCFGGVYNIVQYLLVDLSIVVLIFVTVLLHFSFKSMFYFIFLNNWNYKIIWQAFFYILGTLVETFFMTFFIIVSIVFLLSSVLVWFNFFRKHLNFFKFSYLNFLFIFHLAFLNNGYVPLITISCSIFGCFTLWLVIINYSIRLNLSNFNFKN